MKLISWNVNGLRAAVGKGFLDFFASADADVLALQETKLQAGQIDFAPQGYGCFWHHAEKKGYSGTAVFTRFKPLRVSYGMDMGERFEGEGRVITLDMGEFYFVTVYTPNSRRELERLSYRCEWEDAFRAYVKSLDADKPVVICGDLNVAHREIDLKNPKSNRGNAGFTDEEREKMTLLLDSGFCDTFRTLHPDVTDAYTWWSYMGRAREKNVGWRIDYFLVSVRLMPRVRYAGIMPEVMGSDHCPVVLELD